MNPSRWMVVALMLGMLALPSTAEAQAPTSSVPVNSTVHADNGRGRIDAPGLGCGDGGQGASWHYDWVAPLAATAVGPVGGELLVNLDLHSDVVRTPGVDVSSADVIGRNEAFLLGDESSATIANGRGTIRLTLRSGSCSDPSLEFDGETFSGGGNWVVDHGTGVYTGADGSGTFTVGGTVAPGADNPLDLTLTGSIATTALPALEVTVVDTFWGGLGLDYVTRRPTVVFRIANVGTGDAFGARLTNVTSPTSGVQVLGPTTAGPFDVPAGTSRTVAVRFQLGLLNPCQLVLLGCRFTAALTVDLPDLFGTAHLASATVPTKAPTLPPPL